MHLMIEEAGLLTMQNEQGLTKMQAIQQNGVPKQLLRRSIGRFLNHEYEPLHHWDTQ